MSRKIIIVQGVSKKYSRGTSSGQTYGLRDLFRELMGKQSLSTLRTNEFWALQDISFDLEAGGSLALLGRNGSGKSTLLKILAGLIKNDAGSVGIYGHVQALINLGAGFNPRLTGRENILNIAAVIGMSKKETLETMTRIIDFAELDDFIEQPVETYSSGMKARLGFSVVSHVNPDILLIDEVLSVGDMAFSNKCKLRMEELKQQGVTMILVSHSLSMVKYFCEQAIWLDKGIMQCSGPVKDVCNAYESYMMQQGHKSVELPTEKKQNLFSRFVTQNRIENTFSFRNPKLQNKHCIDKSNKVVLQSQSPLALDPEELSCFGAAYNETKCVRDLRVTLLSPNRGGKLFVNAPLTAIVEGEFVVAPASLLIGVYFFNEEGILAGCLTTYGSEKRINVAKGEFAWIGRHNYLKIPPGKYVLSLIIMDGTSYFFRNPVSTVEVFPRSTPSDNFLLMSGAQQIFTSDGNENKIKLPKDILMTFEEWG